MLEMDEVAREEEKAAEWARRKARTNGVVVVGGARVVLADIKAGNGYVHVVDTSMAPPALFAPTPPPRPPAPRAPPSEAQQQQQQVQDLLLSALLVTSPPPGPAVYLNAPPPVLTPISAYWQARPPPPGPVWSRSPPPFPPGGGRARRPIIHSHFGSFSFLHLRLFDHRVPGTQ